MRPGITTLLLHIGVASVFLTCNTEVWAQNPIWAKTAIGGVGGSAIAVDGTGNSYITGSFSGTAMWGEGAAQQTRTSVGSFDMFVAKYDSAGILQWGLDADPQSASTRIRAGFGFRKDTKVIEQPAFELGPGKTVETPIDEKVQAKTASPKPIPPITSRPSSPKLEPRRHGDTEKKR